MENLDELLKQVQNDPGMAIVTAIATVSIILLAVLYFLYRKARTQRNEAWDWSDSKDEDVAGMEELHKAELNQRKQDYFELLKKKSDLEDKLSVAQNRADCAEGKLRAYDNKMVCMEFAIQALDTDLMGADLTKTFEEISRLVKK